MVGGLFLIEPFQQRNIVISPVLLAIRCFLAAALLAWCLYLITASGQISLMCERQVSISCQRQRTLIYGLFKQENSLELLNPIKQHRVVRAEGESSYQLMLDDVDRLYLLYPAHTLSQLEKVVDGKKVLLSLDDALTDMEAFKHGEAGNTRHYRDRINIVGGLLSFVQVLAGLPILLGIWLFFETHFSGITSRHN
ncbi:MAG: hypothetical protein ACTS2F_25165 [Thainema sp.]